LGPRSKSFLRKYFCTGKITLALNAMAKAAKETIAKQSKQQEKKNKGKRQANQRGQGPLRKTKAVVRNEDSGDDQPKGSPSKYSAPANGSDEESEEFDVLDIGGTGDPPPQVLNTPVVIAGGGSVSSSNRSGRSISSQSTTSDNVSQPDTTARQIQCEFLCVLVFP
jgi:hypothetical protein